MASVAKAAAITLTQPSPNEPGNAGKIKVAKTVMGTKRKNLNQKGDTSLPDNKNPARRGR